MTPKTFQALLKLIRRQAGARANLRCIVVPGDGAPVLKGRPRYWTKDYYLGRCWWPSTERVEVGSAWLDALLKNE